MVSELPQAAENVASPGPPAFQAGAAIATCIINQTAAVKRLEHREAAQWWFGVFSGLMGAAVADIGAETAELLVASLNQHVPEVAKAGQQ